MQPSGAQKGIKVMSILAIVFGVFGILVGFVLITGGAMIAGDPAASARIDQQTGLSAGSVTFVATMTGIIMLVSAGLEVVLGILGLGASRDNQKIMPVWVLALISLIAAVVGFIMNIINGAGMTNILPLLVNLVIPALFFYFANTVKREAGR